MISKVILFCAINIAFCYGASISNNPSRIVGGAVTNIEQYPYAVALLTSGTSGSVFRQDCGGTILTNRIVLSAASCFGTTHWIPLGLWQIRVGSNQGSHGGDVYRLRFYVIHADFGHHIRNDIALLQTSTVIQYGPNVAPAQLAGAGYILPDNEVVWGIGWGSSEDMGSGNDVLREVDVLVISHEDCVQRYPDSVTSTAQMCTGWLGIGEKDHCYGDQGGPLIHKGSRGDVVVGVCSWASTCGRPEYPGVNTRVSEYASWIVSGVWFLNNS